MSTNDAATDKPPRWRGDGYVPRRSYRILLSVSNWTALAAVITSALGFISFVMAGLSTDSTQAGGRAAVVIGLALIAVGGLLKLVSLATWHVVPEYDRPVPYGGL